MTQVDTVGGIYNKRDPEEETLRFAIGSKVKPRGLDGPEMVVVGSRGDVGEHYDVAWFREDSVELRSEWPGDALEQVEGQAPDEKKPDLDPQILQLLASLESMRSELEQRNQMVVNLATKCTQATALLRSMSPKIAPEIEPQVAARLAVETHETMKREANEQLERLSKKIKDAGI